MVRWECPTNPWEASGLDPEAVHVIALFAEHSLEDATHMLVEKDLR
jgi:hypothetical protein